MDRKLLKLAISSGLTKDAAPFEETFGQIHLSSAKSRPFADNARFKPKRFVGEWSNGNTLGLTTTSRLFREHGNTNVLRHEMKSLLRSHDFVNPLWVDSMMSSDTYDLVVRERMDALPK